MAVFSLPKSARLSKRADFSAIRESGDSWHGRYMVMGGWQSGDGRAARCGVITSRKVGGAVDRVRVRRRLREIFRLHRREIIAGVQLVVVARKSATTASYGALQDEWRALADRGGYLKKEP